MCGTALGEDDVAVPAWIAFVAMWAMSSVGEELRLC